MPAVACLSCSERDTVSDVRSIEPQGDWECENCGWHVGKIVSRGWS